MNTYKIVIPARVYLVHQDGTCMPIRIPPTEDVEVAFTIRSEDGVTALKMAGLCMQRLIAQVSG
jgi:hypothetical protein